MMHLAIPFATKTVAMSKAGGMVLGMLSGMLGFATTEITTGNVTLALFASALSSAVVAYFSYRPKVIVAQSQAKISESELLGKETAALIQTLKSTADQNSRIAALQVSARHKIQGFLQHAVSHIEYLEMSLKEHQVSNVPIFTVGDVDEVMRELDTKIEAIKCA